MFRRLTATAAVSGALVLSLSGCLGEAEESARDTGGAVKLAAAQVLAKVTDKAEQVDTYRSNVSTRMNMTIQGQRVESSMEMSGQIRLRPQPAIKATATVSGSAGGQSLPGGSRRMEILMLGGDFYLNMGEPALTGGKPWGKVPADAMAGQNSGDLLKQIQNNGPAEQTRMLTQSPNVREAGKETVDGVTTTRYSGTLSQQDMQRLSPQSRDKLDELYKSLNIQQMRIDIWVGDDGLPRKQTAEMTAAEGAVSVTAYFSGYGQPVDITAPPADQVGTVKLP